MKNNPKAKRSIPMRSTRRKPVGSSGGEDLVEIRPLFEDAPFPTLVTPKSEDLVLNDWARDNATFVQSLWEDKRAVLFRDFARGPAGSPDADERTQDIDSFNTFTGIAGSGARLPYIDRSTPRESYGKNVYCTTIYPSEYSIRLHNEGSYWAVHALKAFFSCITAPETGGATPVGDVHAVYNRVDPKIRAEFEQRKWALVRNYNSGFALPWQEVFQTNDRAEVETYCNANKIEFEWLDEEHLRTRQVREPILDHPRTGEPLWHNHAAFFHISSREAHIRDALSNDFAEDELPYNTTYGDGGAIDPEVVAHINAAYDAELVRFQWQVGDVHMVDNARLAHARDPFTGDRLILVALMEGFVPPWVTQSQ